MGNLGRAGYGASLEGMPRFFFAFSPLNSKQCSLGLWP